MGKLGDIQADFIMAINLPEIKAQPPPQPFPSLFVVLIHIRVRLVAHFDHFGEVTWPRLQMHNPETLLTIDPWQLTLPPANGPLKHTLLQSSQNYISIK